MLVFAVVLFEKIIHLNTDDLPSGTEPFLHVLIISSDGVLPPDN